MKRIEGRAELAKNHFRQGYNCCQSVALAFSDILDMDEGKIAALAAGFGGGRGRMREVCGAFSGMTLVAGMLSPAANPADHDARTANYALVQEFASRFREENGGSIICRELLGIPHSRSESPTPSERTDGYYKKRPCLEIVGTAAQILEDKINSSQ